MMKADESRDPPERRLEEDSAVMLYDPSLAGNFAACWFDPAHWSAVGGLRGTARGRGTTHFFAVDGHEFALRHYRRGGLIARMLGDRYADLGEARSRPLREFRVTRRLQALGLPVAPVVAARYVSTGIFSRGDLITLRLLGTRTLAEVLLAEPLVDISSQTSNSSSPIDWSAVGATIAAFHAVGLCHADLNAHNLLVDDIGRWHLLDFDRAEFRSPGFWRDGNLVRLRRSLLKLHDELGRSLDEDHWYALLAGYRERLVAQGGVAG